MTKKVSKVSHDCIDVTHKFVIFSKIELNESVRFSQYQQFMHYKSGHTASSMSYTERQSIVFIVSVLYQRNREFQNKVDDNFTC